MKAHFEDFGILDVFDDQLNKKELQILFRKLLFDHFVSIDVIICYFLFWNHDLPNNKHSIMHYFIVMHVCLDQFDKDHKIQILVAQELNDTRF